jgi:hypothetical protein
MVARIDAGGGDLASAFAWASDQHQSRDVVLRCRIGRWHYRHRRRQLGMARRGNGAGVDRTAGDLCPRNLPESPYWVRAQDRKRRIAETLSAGGAVNEDDRTWYAKAGRVGIRQVFMPDVQPSTLVALFVACSCVDQCASCCIFGTVGGWMPYYLSTEKLCVLGHRRLLRPMAGRLVGRQDRPARRLHRNADRGRRFYDPVGLHRQPFNVVGVRSSLELRVPRFLGTEHDLDCRGVPDPHPWCG